MKDLKKIGYSKREAAHITSLSARTIHDLIRSGVLKAINVGSRVVISAKSLERLIDTGAMITSTNFEDVGHSVHFDALEPFVEALAAFLERVD